MGYDKYKNKDYIKNADYNKNIKKVNIGDFCTNCMQIFGANTNLMRHIPAICDGLKPGERRLLYTMWALINARNDSPRKKVNTIAGMTVTIHPHGESSVYETLVGLAQKWNNTEPLIDGHGNYGTIFGDPPGAPRYIEARLSEYAYKCFFQDFSTDIVDMKSSYGGDTYEPEFLPSRYPHVLINNSLAGIGYGAYCGVHPYNFKEVVELTLKLMDDPDYENIVLIPDSPTGADIIDEGQFKNISQTGIGNFKSRGIIEVDEERNGLIIRSIPLQVDMSKIDAKLVEMFRENKIQGFKKFNDNSDYPNNLELHYYFKKEIDPVSVMHSMYKNTELQKTISVQLNLIDDYEKLSFNIRSILLYWIDFRRETKRRDYNHKLIKAKEREHIIDTLIFILNKDNAEKTTTIAKNSEDKAEMIKNLMKTYTSLSSLQAETIAEMKQTALNKGAYKGYLKEKEKLVEKIEKYEKVIRSQKKIDKVIKDELEEGIQLFGKPRRSKVISIEGEETIRNTDHLVVFTLNGFVKKLPSNSTTIGYISLNDHPVDIKKVSNLTDLLIFDETGKISKLPVHTLRDSELKSEGEKLSKFCTINGQIRTILPKPTEESLKAIPCQSYIIMITKNGIIKKTSAESYSNIRNELVGILIDKNDSLIDVKILIGTKDILIYTNKGFGVRVNSDDIKETSRMTKGVKAITLEENESVIGTDIISDKDKYLFALTDKGTGKKCSLESFEQMKRNAKPLRIISLEDDENVTTIRTVKGKEVFLAYLKNSIETIEIKDVTELPRLSKGKKLIPVRKGEIIIDVKEQRN